MFQIANKNTLVLHLLLNAKNEVQESSQNVFN